MGTGGTHFTEAWVSVGSSVWFCLDQHFAFPGLMHPCKWVREAHGILGSHGSRYTGERMLPFSTVGPGDWSVSFLHVWPGSKQGIPSKPYEKRRHTLVLRVEIPKCRTLWSSEAGMWWVGKALPRPLSGALTHSSQWISASRSMKQDAAYGKDCK